MASNPGVLTKWPWASLGNYKYLLVAPFAVHSTYSFITGGSERDLSNFLILPLMLSRVLHNLLWISYSRHQTAKGKTIVDKSIDFDQLDRENKWDDQILLNCLLFYVGQHQTKAAQNLPLWRTDGVIWIFLLHAGAVEFLYYWLHRAMHHHFLYTRYHSHHHSSIVNDPRASFSQPFGELIASYAIFLIAVIPTLFARMASICSITLYIIYGDFMSNLGHCNFECIPRWLFSMFPPLKYIMYTPSFHSLHHTQFRTNYCLFMPFYDYVYGTMDKSSDTLYEKSLLREAKSPDVVHLTHLTTPKYVYNLHLGFASLTAQPYKSRWYLALMWPLTLWSMIVNWLFGRTFVLERNVFKNLNLQIWSIPKYAFQYHIKSQEEAINGMIEEAVLSAEKKGAKVLSLGLLNQGEELNENGELFLSTHPHLNVKLVDGSSFVVAIVLNTIPKEANHVLICGNVNKVAFGIALALCQAGIQVLAVNEGEYEKLRRRIGDGTGNKLVHSKAGDVKIWLVGEGVRNEEQLRAPKGTTFIPFSPFPLKKIRKDCSYVTTPAMLAPKHLQNVDYCENWLPRRVMSAWRIAGIVHAAEEWGVHECGDTMLDVRKTWEACLKNGFRPLSHETNNPT